MGNKSTRIAAAPVGDADHYCETQNMKVGALTLTATLTPGGASPTARKVTCTRTVDGNADTPGTLLVTGKSLSGQTITETLIPGAHTVLVTGSKLFASITSVVGAGWVIDGNNDTIVVGMAAENYVAVGGGTLHGIYISTTAAGTITCTDATGTIMLLPASAAVGLYEFDIDYVGFLRVETAAASDIFVIHTPSSALEYATS